MKARDLIEEKFYEIKNIMTHDDYINEGVNYSDDDVEELMIEFAKYHIKNNSKLEDIE